MGWMRDLAAARVGQTLSKHFGPTVADEVLQPRDDPTRCQGLRINLILMPFGSADLSTVSTQQHFRL